MSTLIPYLGRQEWLKSAQPFELSYCEVAARAFITHEDKVLLTCESNLNDSWWLPGGRITPGESLQDGAMREVEEETALKVVMGDVVGMFDVIVPDTQKGINKHLLHFVFYASLPEAPDFIERACTDTDPEHPGKVSKMRWFTRDEVAALPSVFPSFLRDWPSLLVERAA